MLKRFNKILKRLRPKFKTGLKVVKRFWKVALYVAFVLIATFWIIYGVQRFWASNINRTAAANHAEVISVRDKVRSFNHLLDMPKGYDHITIDQATSSYQSLCQKDLSLPLSGASLVTHGLTSAKISNLNKQAASNVKEIKTTACSTAELLTAVRKFMLYDPQADLTPLLNGSEQSTDRLIIAAKGIATLADEVKSKNVTQAKTISDWLQAISGQARTTSAVDAAVWCKSVAETQNNILQVIKQTASPLNYQDAALSGIAQSYLSLRSR